MEGCGVDASKHWGREVQKKIEAETSHLNK